LRDSHTMSQILMYAKIFKSMFEGTLRGKPDPQLVFVNLMTHADKEGFVDRHFKAISDETGIPIERVEAAVTELESPDPESRSPDFEGKRLERIDEHRRWGWRIVNYRKYREMQDGESRRESQRLRQQACRDRARIRTAETSPTREPEALRLLSFLNEKSGRKFRNSEESLKPILARMGEKDVTEAGAMMMIERQVKLWKGDGKMEEYLRPSTLFGKERFNEYYAARELPVSKNSSNGSVKSAGRGVGTLNEGTASLFRGAAQKTGIQGQVQKPV
jgi:uncharacterized phage protein (TIGR02220 family)